MKYTALAVGLLLAGCASPYEKTYTLDERTQLCVERHASWPRIGTRNERRKHMEKCLEPWHPVVRKEQAVHAIPRIE